jgi:hypothetical protein
MKNGVSVAFVLMLYSTSVWADPACSKFTWNLDTERALLSGNVQAVQSGTSLDASKMPAFSLVLASGAKLPFASQKPVDSERYSGYVTLDIASAGGYLVSLSAEGWIDAVQDGVAAGSKAHTGDPNCPGLRKSVRFTLSASPLTLEISGATSDRIVVAVTRAH